MGLNRFDARTPDEESTEANGVDCSAGGTDGEAPSLLRGPISPRGGQPQSCSLDLPHDAVAQRLLGSRQLDILSIALRHRQAVAPGKLGLDDPAPGLTGLLAPPPF